MAISGLTKSDEVARESISRRILMALNLLRYDERNNSLIVDIKESCLVFE